MKSKLIAVMCFTAAWVTQAQDYQQRAWMPLENRIGFAMGIGSVTSLDKKTSPLIYRSQPKNLRLFYNLETNDFLFSLDLDFKVGGNTAKYHPGRTMFFEEEDLTGKREEKRFPAGGTFMGARFSVGAFYKIPSTQESTFKVAVGGRVMNELFYPQGWTTAGLFNALSFSPEAMAQHRVGEHHAFTAGVRIPVLALITRPPYHNTISAPNSTLAGGFLKNTQWAGPEKFLAPAFALGYQYQFNQKWGAGLNYEFNWYKMSDPESLRMVSQSVLANFYHQL